MYFCMNTVSIDRESRFLVIFTFYEKNSVYILRNTSVHFIKLQSSVNAATMGL